MLTIEQIKEIVENDPWNQESRARKKQKYNSVEGIEQQLQEGNYGREPCTVFWYTQLVAEKTKNDFTCNVENLETFETLSFSIHRQSFDKDGNPV